MYSGNRHDKNIAVLILLIGFSHSRTGALPTIQNLVNGFFESELKEKVTGGFFLAMGSFVIFKLIRSASFSTFELIEPTEQGKNSMVGITLNESDREKIIESSIKQLPKWRLDKSVELDFLLRVLMGLTDGFDRNDVISLVEQANAQAWEEEQYISISHFTQAVDEIHKQKILARARLNT